MLYYIQLMGVETRTVSAYPQLASYHLNVPLMKESQHDERYTIWVKKSMTKREDKNLLHKVTLRPF